MQQLRKLLLHFGSLRQQLILFNIILLLFMFIIIIFSNLRNLDTLSNYRIFSQQYNHLSDFYQQINTGSLAAQNHLYTKSESEWKYFKYSWKSAKENLGFISKNTLDDELLWRTTLLNNMIATYDETFEALRANQFESFASYSQTYDFFVSTVTNISRTAPQHYNLLTNEMVRSRQKLEKYFRLQIILTFSGSICMLLLSIVFSSIYIYGITNPIQSIVKNINKIKQGKYNLQQVKGASREIAVLCEAFDDMARSVQLYISSMKANAILEKRLLETENHNLKMSELLTQTEFRALQGQMNPHFLFNTLSLISKMAYMENAPETSEMMETVADLLRYSLSKSAKTSDLLGEIECVRNYYIIQQKRIGHRVVFGIYVSTPLNNIQMPGMILQPIIENAVIHGVPHMTKGAQINVCVYQDEFATYLSIQDNGKGMTNDTIEHILADSNDGQNGIGEHIGLSNVLNRLRIFYGNTFRLRIVSDVGEGSMILLTLPFE